MNGGKSINEHMYSDSYSHVLGFEHFTAQSMKMVFILPGALRLANPTRPCFLVSGGGDLTHRPSLQESVFSSHFIHLILIFPLWDSFSFRFLLPNQDNSLSWTHVQHNQISIFFTLHWSLSSFLVLTWIWLLSIDSMSPPPYPQVFCSFFFIS